MNISLSFDVKNNNPNESNSEFAQRIADEIDVAVTMAVGYDTSTMVMHYDYELDEDESEEGFDDEPDLD